MSCVVAAAFDLWKHTFDQKFSLKYNQIHYNTIKIRCFISGATLCPSRMRQLKKFCLRRKSETLKAIITRGTQKHRGVAWVSFSVNCVIAWVFMGLRCFLCTLITSFLLIWWVQALINAVRNLYYLKNSLRKYWNCQYVHLNMYIKELTFAFAYYCANETKLQAIVNSMCRLTLRVHLSEREFGVSVRG